MTIFLTVILDDIDVSVQHVVVQVLEHYRFFLCVYVSGSFMVSDQCNFSGSNTIYFYPDCRTALVGTFGPNGQLQAGRVTEIIGLDHDVAHNPEPVFLAPDTNVSRVKNTRRRKFILEMHFSKMATAKLHYF